MTEREKIVEVMARGLCRLRIQSNLRYDTKVRGAAWLQQAEDAGWHAFVEEASAALTALEASGMAVVPREPTPEMYRAGSERLQMVLTSADGVWGAMLSAASPTPSMTENADE